MKDKKKVMTLQPTKLEIFNVIVHRDLQLGKVKRVYIVKLTSSGRVYITFLVDHDFHQFPKTGKVVVMEVDVEKLFTTSDGEYSTVKQEALSVRA